MHDRSEEELERTFVRMGITASEFPFVTITAAEEKMSPAEVVEKYIKTRTPKPEVVLIEGLDMWARDAINMEVATDIMRGLRDLAQHYNCAVLATVGCPKQKPKERYSMARDQIFGSQAWGRRADTVVVFAQYTEDDKKGHKAGDRDVHVLLRNAPEQRITMRFVDNALIEVNQIQTVLNEAPIVDIRRTCFEFWLDDKDSFTMAEALITHPKASDDTLRRWARELGFTSVKTGAREYEWRRKSNRTR
jgi:hypothetical protein